MGRLRPSMAIRIPRVKLCKHIEALEDELQKRAEASGQQLRFIALQGAELEKLLDGFRPVPLTKKARSRWVGRERLEALRKLIPKPRTEEAPAVSQGRS